MSGKFTQIAVNLKIALLYISDQQPQAWHDSLEMTFNIVVRFNV